MDKSSDYRGWGAVLFIVLITAIIRLNLLHLPLERDEGVYAYIGQLILNGFPPYKYAFDMRLPGLYLAYVFILKVFGQTNIGIHAGLILVNAATCILLFLLGRKLLNSFTGVIAAGSFAVLSLSSSVLGAMTHPEHFVVFFAVAGLYLLISALENDTGGYGLKIFSSGFLLGTGMLMKQHGMLFIFFGGIYLTITLLFNKTFSSKALLTRLGTFFAGSALPYILTCLILLSAGVFDDFWFSTITYARAYVGLVPLDRAFFILKTRLFEVIGASLTIWVLAGIGLTAQLWYKAARKRFLFLTLFFIFSFLAVMPGLYFRRHYFILFLPAGAVMAAVGADSLRNLFSKTGHNIKISILVFLLTLMIAYPIYQRKDFLFFSSPEKASRMIYGGNPFPESQEIAKYIKKHSAQSDTIAILGSEPQIYFYSKRLSATKYIYTYPLMENHRFSIGMQQEMIREIEEAKPLFLIFVQLQISWLVRPESKTIIFDWFNKYQSQFYERVGVVDMIPNDETKFYWDGAASAVTPQSNNNIFVYRRKTGL